MLGIALNVLSRGLSFMPIILGLIALYWSKSIFSFIKQQMKIIPFARTLPSLPIIPLIGNYQLIMNPDDVANLIIQWNRKIKKSLGLWLGSMPQIITTDPRDYEILFSNSTAVEKDLNLYKILLSFMVDILLMGKGDAKYRRVKKLLLPFTNGKYISNYIEILKKQSNEFVKVLGDKTGKGEFDIEENAIHCIGDIASDVIFGIPGKAQQGNPNKILLYGTERMVKLMGQRVGKIWQFLDIFYRIFNKDSKEYYETANAMHKTIGNIVKERKEKYMREKQKNIEQIDIDQEIPTSIIDVLIDDMMKTNSLTENELKHQLIGSIVGIHDTLHGTLSFLYLMLAIHPEVQEKVREEAIEFTGDGIIDQKTTEKMKYTQMVILETIRLFPIIPMFPRKTTQELKLATCTLPKGTSVGLYAFETHRDPAHWIDPEIFNPERFTPENSKDRHKFAFIPFSSGLRKCAGFNFAFLCLKIIIAHTIRHYKFSTSRKMEDIKLLKFGSVRSTNGYPVSVERLN